MAGLPEDNSDDEPRRKTASPESKTEQDDEQGMCGFYFMFTSFFVVPLRRPTCADKTSFLPVDALEQLLRERLHVLSQTEGEERKAPLLNPLTIEGVANFIKKLQENPEGVVLVAQLFVITKIISADRKKILIMTGAGISTGIVVHHMLLFAKTLF